MVKKFDEEAADRGKRVFNRPILGETGMRLHPDQVGPGGLSYPRSGFHHVYLEQAHLIRDRHRRIFRRGIGAAYRKPTVTSEPLDLESLALHFPGGRFYLDGRFAILAGVVNHYDQFFGLGLSVIEAKENDLVE